MIFFDWHKEGETHIGVSRSATPIRIEIYLDLNLGEYEYRITNDGAVICSSIAPYSSVEEAKRVAMSVISLRFAF